MVDGWAWNSEAAGSNPATQTKNKYCKGNRRHMRILTLHSINWGNPERSAVRIIADTDQGFNEDIGTPYGPSSILWNYIQTIPVDQIGPYVELTVETE